MRGWWGKAMAALAIAGAAPGSAAWYEARTDHFLLTVDDSEEGARTFATRLERFDQALRQLYGLPDNPDQRRRPIAIYALKPDLFGPSCLCPGVLGYYRPRAAGSFIFAAQLPDMDRRAATGWWSSQVLLLHEYGHHFTFANYPIAYPLWFSEGFAEFNANAGFEADGSVVVGYPANYRAVGLREGTRLSIRQVLAPFRFGYREDPALIYERGWLLTHYLMLNRPRTGQLATYLGAVARGTDSVAAAQAAFGDLGKLDAELEAYRRGRLAAPLRVPAATRPITATVRPLTAGETAMLPLRLQVLNGTYSGRQYGLALKVEKMAARYPDEPAVQLAAVEGSYQARRYDEADAAVDRALAKAPADPDALDWKGLIAARRLRDAKDTDTAHWSATRDWFLKANRAAPDNVLPLLHFYQSFDWAKATPRPGAVNGLRRAAVLAPESREVRLALAQQELTAGNGAAARMLLQPLAYAPHRAIDDNKPLDAIALIDAGKLAEARAALTKGQDD